MAKNKTQPTEVPAQGFLAAVEPPAKRADAELLDALFRKVTGKEPMMWGPTIIGYGKYHYRYDSGHEGDMCRVGFSPRKAKHSLYLLGCGGEDAQMEALLARLGKHSRSVACLYVNKLADIDLGVLKQMIERSWSKSFDDYPES